MYNGIVNIFYIFFGDLTLGQAHVNLGKKKIKETRIKNNQETRIKNKTRKLGLNTNPGN